MPFFGGVVGCFAYELTIANHIPSKQTAPLAEIKEMDEFNTKEAKLKNNEGETGEIEKGRG